MNFSLKFTITNALAAGLIKIESSRCFLDAAKLSEDRIAEMRSRALVLEAHHTTSIEGTHLTRRSQSSFSNFMRHKHG